MSSQDTDRNLLFGVLALQLDLIDASQFAEACGAWAARKGTPLADLLSERGWVTPADRADVERLLRRKLERNGGDARQSLTSLVGWRAEEGLSTVDDFEVHSVLTEILTEHAGQVPLTVDVVPETRGQYTLIRLHAQGGLGRVWLARDADLGREVALKELRPERADDPWSAARFLAGGADHRPARAPRHRPGLRAGPPARGPPAVLHHAVRPGPDPDRGRPGLPPQPRGRPGRAAGAAGLLNAFVAVCNAVAYAHSRGVIHRDLKGQNVVLGDFGEVIVLDWGLAKLVDRPEAGRGRPPVVLDAPRTTRGHTMPGQVLGTPAYMAPEQAEGRTDRIDRRTRRLRAGGDPVRDPDRPAAVRRLGHATEVLPQVREESPPRPRQVCPAVAAGAGGGLPAGDGQAARGPLRHGRRAGAGGPALAGRRAGLGLPRAPAVRLGRWARRHRSTVTGRGGAAGGRGRGPLRLHAHGRQGAGADGGRLPRGGGPAETVGGELPARPRGRGPDVLRLLGDPLLFAPRMDPLRRHMLSTVLQSYQRLTDGSREDLDLRYHLGSTYLRYSRVAREQGAVEGGRRLRGDRPGDPYRPGPGGPDQHELPQRAGQLPPRPGRHLQGREPVGTGAEASFRAAVEVWGQLAGKQGGSGSGGPWRSLTTPWAPATCRRIAWTWRPLPTGKP